MRFPVTALLLLIPLSVRADDPREQIVERFLTHCRENDRLSDDLKQQVAEAVQRAREDAARANDAVTEGLRVLSPEFAAALQALANEQAAGAVEQLEPLTAADEPFLAAEATFFLARALLLGERHEEALPKLVDVTEHRAADTLRAGEAMFLRAQAEAAMLDRSAATESYQRFLAEFPAAPPRMRNEAEAALIDIEEAEFDLLTDIHSKMNYSRRRLRLEHSGQRTQEVQEEVVALLTEMIDELEKKCGTCKGCKCSGGGMGGANPGMSSGTSQEARITEHTGPRSAWVDLSKRHEDPTAFNAAKNRLPLQYRELVEQYYRSFQDDAGR